MLITNSTKSTLEDTKKIRSKSSKKSVDKDLAFFDSAITSSYNDGAIQTIPGINPFLFLQELDTSADDHKTLTEHGWDILECLNALKIGMLQGELPIHIILHLKSILKNNKNKFEHLNLQSVIDEIILRAEVEIAKLEALDSKS